MKLTQKYNQVIKDSRIKEFNSLCEVYGIDAMIKEFGNKGLKAENLYHIMRETISYAVILEYFESRYDKNDC